MYKERRGYMVQLGLIILIVALFVACPNGATPDDPVEVGSISYNGGLPIKVLIDTELVTSVGTPVVSPNGATGSFAITEGELPEGLAFNSGTGAITGKPTTQNGDGVKITIQFTASGDYTGTATTSVTVVVLPRIQVIYISYNNDQPISGFVGTSLDASIGSPTVAPAGADGVFKVKAGMLPDGLSLNGKTGQITGTPEKPNADGIDVTVAFSGSGYYFGTAVTVVRFIVREIISVTGIQYNGGNLIETYVGTGIDRNIGTPTITPEGAKGTFSIRSGVLPAGLSLDGSTGEIKGTPETVSTDAVEVRIEFVGDRDRGYDGSAETTVEIKVSPIPQTGIPVNSIEYNAGQPIRTTQGVQFNDPAGMPTHSPTGATGTYSITEGALPDGLSIDESSGEITGKPSTFTRDGAEVTIKFTATHPYSGTVETTVDVTVLYPVTSIAYSDRYEISIPSGKQAKSVSVEPKKTTGKYTFVEGEGLTDPEIIGGLSLDANGALQIDGFQIRRVGSFNLRIKVEGTGDYAGVAYADVNIAITLEHRAFATSWKPDSTAFVGHANAPYLTVWEPDEYNSFQITSLLPADEDGTQYGAVKWGSGKTNRILAARSSGVPGFDLWMPDPHGTWQLVGSFPEGDGEGNPYSGDVNVTPSALAWSTDETTIVSHEILVGTNTRHLLRVWRWSIDKENFVLAHTLDIGDGQSDKVKGLVCAQDGESFAFSLNGKPILYRWDEGKSEYVEDTSLLSDQVLANVATSAWSMDLSSLVVTKSGSVTSDIITVWTRANDGSFSEQRSSSVTDSQIETLLVGQSAIKIVYGIGTHSISAVEWSDGNDKQEWKLLGSIEAGNSFNSVSWSPNGKIVVGTELTKSPKFLILE